MKKFLLILVLVLLAIAALATWWMARQRELEERYEQAVAAWIDVGGVMSFTELKPAPLPDEQNAAVLYRQVATQLNDLTDADHDRLSELDSPSALAEIIDERAETIEILRQATARPNSVRDETLYDDPMRLMQDLGRNRDIRTMARLLAASATVHADRGDLERAAADIAALLRLSTHAAEPPCLLTGLIGSATRILALDRLEELFRDRPLPQQGIASAIREIDFLAERRRILIGEAAFTMEMTAEQAKSLGGGLGGAAEPSIEERAAFLIVMRQWIDALDDPNVDRPVDNTDTRLAELWLPAISRAIDMFDLDSTRLVMARTALDLRSYRNEHGSYPETWDMPVDRTTGQPLNYERTTTGFRIFSDSGDEQLDWQWQ